MKRWTIVTLAAGLFAGTASAEVQFLGLILPPPAVTIEYDHSAPLVRRSYSWGTIHMAVPQYVGTVRAAIDANLQKRGWQLMPSGGSTTIFAHGDIRGEAQLLATYSGSGEGAAGHWLQSWTAQGFGPGWKPYYGEAVLNALDVPENNLVVDIFDSSDHRLLFRGVMQDELSAPEKQTTKTLTKTIKRMFSKFPPKK